MKSAGPLFLASICFGAMAVCVQAAGGGLTAMQIAFVRFAGSLLVMMAATGGGAIRPRAATVTQLGMRGLLGAVAVVFYYRGIQGAGAALATLVQSTYPLFTALFAIGLMDERFSGRLAIALGLNLIGMWIVLDPEHAATASLGPGIASALTAAVLSGGAVATARHLRRIEGAAVITTWFMLIGTVVTAPSILHGLPPLDSSLVAALAGVVLTSIAGQWLLHHALGHTTATRGSLAAATNVVSATVLQALFLGATIPARVAAGAALMLAAVGLAGSRR